MIFILYLVYKLVFDLIVPVSKATASVKDRVRQMQEEQLRQQQAATASRPAAPQKEGDYIDFEEIK